MSEVTCLRVSFSFSFSSVSNWPSCLFSSNSENSLWRSPSFCSSLIISFSIVRSRSDPAEAKACKSLSNSDVPCDNPDLLSPDSPDLFSSDNRDLISSGNPDLPSSDNPDLFSSDNSDLLSSDNPDLHSNHIPDLLSSENPDLISSDNPDLLSSDNPDLISSIFT